MDTEIKAAVLDVLAQAKRLLINVNIVVESQIQEQQIGGASTVPAKPPGA